MLYETVKSFQIHFLVISERHFIEEFNSYINQFDAFDAKVITHHATHYENAKRLIIENELDYIYVDDSSLINNNLNELSDLLSHYNKSSCNIIAKKKC